MSKVIADTREQIREMILSALGKAVAEGQLPDEPIPAFTVEQPADCSHGDFACNAAMVSARAFRKAPRAIAEIIIENIQTAGTRIEKVEAAGPGFINFFVGASYFADVLRDVVEQKESYGRSDYGKGKKIMVEFVSANPTGPMHMGNARGGALGDCLAAVLEAAGYRTEREFYVNDAGNQIDKFALSLDVRYQQLILGEDAVELPEDAYHGGDIIERAKGFREVNGDEWLQKSEEERRAALVAYALPLNIERMQNDLLKYRITYDTWFMESSLHESGAVREIIDRLTEKGLTYEKEGAVWYKATEFGSSKDEVLIRANGNPTYFAADIAYHYNKFAVRGFDTVIDVWGADHHGHVARMKGVLTALGLDGERLEVVLMQLVRMMSAGQPVVMSKRTGKAIQLADLLDEVPVDAARFFFNMCAATSRMDFDLDLAVQQESQNPVYYVQYAHARICSIFRKYAEQGSEFVPADSKTLELLRDPAELELIRCIGDYTDQIVTAAKTREPSGITRYVMELAAKFHHFYGACRVNCDDPALAQARLTLCHCARQVIANVLALMKVDAPEHME
ncbi:MAG: arginine--tRNA ligase [Ruminococcaceae bacterium]|nr:arginine--tRNA ligase [Oscillospiraceae bacterium]